MKDYKEIIFERANNLQILLSEDALEMYNDFINYYISNGDNEKDALDYVINVLTKNSK